MIRPGGEQEGTSFYFFFFPLNLPFSACSVEKPRKRSAVSLYYSWAQQSEGWVGLDGALGAPAAGRQEVNTGSIT